MSSVKSGNTAMNESRGELNSSKATQELLGLLITIMTETGIPETRLNCEKFILAVKLHAFSNGCGLEKPDHATTEKIEYLLANLANEISENNPHIELGEINFEISLVESSGFNLGNPETIH